MTASLRKYLILDTRSKLLVLDGENDPLRLRNRELILAELRERNANWHQTRKFCGGEFRPVGNAQKAA